MNHLPLQQTVSLGAIGEYRWSAFPRSPSPSSLQASLAQEPLVAWTHADDAAVAVHPHWPRHCEAQYEWLAAHAPAELIRLMLGELQAEPVQLSLAAEILGATRTADAQPVLLHLLRHPDPIVREGAVLGFAGWELDDHVREGLTTLLNDPSPAVRYVVQSTLTAP